jgi:capsular polysaccharide biosynthesis protein
MNVETIRKRMTVRLTTPPELLFALTRHWFTVIFCLGVGTVVMVAKVITEPVVYEGNATLVLSSNDSSTVVEQAGREVVGREDTQRFFNSRIEILRSDSVMRKLVKELKAPNLLVQDDNPEEASYGAVRQTVNEVKKKIKEILSYIEHSTIHDYGEENEIQKAVASFRNRSGVWPNPLTNSVELRVYGSSRELLQKELDEWIEAYISRLVEMARESRDFFINSRMRYWTELESKAWAAVDNFKKEKPEISKATQDMLLQEVMQLQILRVDLQRQLQTGEEARPSIVDDPRFKGDSDAKALADKKRALELEYAQILSFFPAESDRARTILDSIKLLDMKLKGTDPGSPGVSQDPGAKRAKLVADEKKYATAITETMARYTAMSEGLEKLQLLEEDYRHAHQTRKSYEFMNFEEADRSESRKNIQVQVADKPYVSWQPHQTFPERQVLLGALGGLALGMLWAVLLELFCEKVRFKNDVLTEFGVPVVAIVPRK